jgi:Fe-S-cluster containining protein
MAEGEPGVEKREEHSALGRLERQVERGNLFAHTALSNNAERINEAESILYGLTDLMIEKGAVTSDEVLRAAAKVRGEMEAKGETIGPGVALRVDGDEEKDDGFVPVNCAQRIHICKAVCCRLQFALSAKEVESGKVKWDLGRPYHIRQESTGYCTHNDPEKKSCRIYHDRPTVCRRYSCAKDERIWKNFEEMELNDEWISENLGESRPLLARARMFKQEEHTEVSVDPSRPDGELEE